MSRKKDQGVTIGALTITLISMAIILILALIKIHIGSRIYYESRQTNILEQEVAALKEENTMLQMKVEKLKYKSEITDTIFTIEDDQGSEQEEGR